MIDVLKLQDFYEDEGLIRSAPQWHRLLWIADGRGMLFVRAGSDFHIKQYAQGGWIVLFGDVFYNTFLQHYPRYLECRLFDLDVAVAYIRLDAEQTADLDYHAMELLETLMADKGQHYRQHTLDFILMLAGDIYFDYDGAALSSREAKLLRELNGLIGANFIEHRDTEFYARKLGVTPRHLNFLLKKAQNRTVVEHIAMRTLSEACAQLLRPELRIQEIGYELGFKTPGQFSNFFKRHMGMMPKAYRKRKGH